MGEVPYSAIKYFTRLEYKFCAEENSTVIFLENMSRIISSGTGWIQPEKKDQVPHVTSVEFKIFKRS